MQCNRCPHNADVQAGKYRLVDFKKTPCASCHYSGKQELKIVDYIDEFHDAKRDYHNAVAIESVPLADVMPVEVLYKALRRLMSLPAPVRDAVCSRLIGLTYREIGTGQGVTPGAAEARVERALIEWPDLKAFFPEKHARALRSREPGQKARVSIHETVESMPKSLFPAGAVTIPASRPSLRIRLDRKRLANGRPRKVQDENRAGTHTRRRRGSSRRRGRRRQDGGAGATRARRRATWASPRPAA